MFLKQLIEGLLLVSLLFLAGLTSSQSFHRTKQRKTRLYSLCGWRVFI